MNLTDPLVAALDVLQSTVIRAVLMALVVVPAAVLLFVVTWALAFPRRFRAPLPPGIRRRPEDE